MTEIIKNDQTATPDTKRRSPRRAAAGIVLAGTVIAGVKIGFFNESAGDTCTASYDIGVATSAEYVNETPDNTRFKLFVGAIDNDVISLDVRTYTGSQQPNMFDMQGYSGLQDVSLESLHSGPELVYPINSHNELLVNVTPDAVATSCRIPITAPVQPAG
ncbi:MAG TPA: hypothetical protein VF575_05110 [Candidatus Saccharimonadales bacterium]|jgi:hypothetical protein